MAGVAVPSLTVTSRMVVRLAGVQLELVPAPGETEVQCSPIVASSQMYCQFLTKYRGNF